MTSGFDKDFENFFADNPTAIEDEWAHVDDQALETISVPSVHPAMDTDRLPMLDMLLRPDELFKTTTPYILTLEVKFRNVIVVQGSHQASLELLASYLQKWAKGAFGRVGQRTPVAETRPKLFILDGQHESRAARF
jgi:hypothetical protein